MELPGVSIIRWCLWGPCPGGWFLKLDADVSPFRGFSGNVRRPSRGIFPCPRESPPAAIATLHAAHEEAAEPFWLDPRPVQVLGQGASPRPRSDSTTSLTARPPGSSGTSSFIWPSACRCQYLLIGCKPNLQYVLSLFLSSD